MNEELQEHIASIGSFLTVVRCLLDESNSKQCSYSYSKAVDGLSAIEAKLSAPMKSVEEWCNYWEMDGKCGERFTNFIRAIQEDARLSDGWLPSDEGWFLPRSALGCPEGFERFLAASKNAHFIDIKIRADGKETWYQGDCLKYLKPLPNPPAQKGS